LVCRAAESSAILGIFRPLVAVRLDWGDLPFRYVRKQRCALLNDMLALKSKLDKRQTAVETFAEDTEDLIKAYGLYPPVALYDACFLYPFHLRNRLIKCASDGPVGTRLDDEIHVEWIRNLAADTPGLSRERLKATCDRMSALIPEAGVTIAQRLVIRRQGSLRLPLQLKAFTSF
jgi:hypothetical protein